MALKLIEVEASVEHSGSKTPLLPGDQKGGRPSDYREEFAVAARKYSLLGATNERIAELLGIKFDRLDDWLTRYPEFGEAIADGREKADAEIAASMYRRACGYDLRQVRREITRVENAKGDVLETHTKVVETTTHVPADTVIGEKWLRLRRHWSNDERPLTLADIVAIADAARAEETRRKFDLEEFRPASSGDDPAARPH